MTRTISWTRVGDGEHGLEHLLLDEGSADGLVIAVEEDRRPFRLAYRLTWDASWRVRDAQLIVTTQDETRTLQLESDGKGHWRDCEARALQELDGCLDIDIWPTPFTNTFALRRDPMAVGERRVFVVAWVGAPELSLRPARQAYTRLADRRYRFESLDSDFSAELVVDADDLVLDYEGLFRRVS
jgi:uncharacterized protein